MILPFLLQWWRPVVLVVLLIGLFGWHRIEVGKARRVGLDEGRKAGEAVGLERAQEQLEDQRKTLEAERDKLAGQQVELVAEQRRVNALMASARQMMDQIRRDHGAEREKIERLEGADEIYLAFRGLLAELRGRNRPGRLSTDR